MSSLMTAERVKPPLPGGLTVKDDLDAERSHLSASTVLPESRMLDLRRSPPREWRCHLDRINVLRELRTGMGKKGIWLSPKKRSTKKEERKKRRKETKGTNLKTTKKKEVWEKNWINSKDIKYREEKGSLTETSKIKLKQKKSKIKIREERNCPIFTET